MAYLTKKQILDAADVQYEDVSAPEWGGMVRVRSLSGFERDQFEAESIQQKGNSRSLNLRNVRARMVALCVVDEDGRQVFSQADVHALGKKSAAALDRIFDAAMRLSGMTQADVDELAENFDEGQSEDSGSG